MPTSFYRAFEDQYRGSRALIKERLRVYLPFITPLAALHPEHAALDLGCGRGEWLELLQEQHIKAAGVDLDDGMLAACRERGLDVQNANAISHLQAQPSQSLLLVTGFHLAEHLPFEVLQELIAQARRVLLPDGLLILETPNPENLVVGTVNFYIDPTHQRPLPHQLLSFLIEQQGFKRIKHLRLQEDPRLLGSAPVSLYDVLAHASPDYAIVAQQSPSAANPNSDPANTSPSIANSSSSTSNSNTSPAASPDPLAAAFATEHGLSLHSLANRYDAQQHAALQACQAATQQAEQALARLTQQAEHTLASLTQNAEQAQARADQLTQELTTLHASISWRLTRPLRWLARRPSR
jgi:SAM-dependent methyltransferase